MTASVIIRNNLGVCQCMKNDPSVRRRPACYYVPVFTIHAVIAGRQRSLCTHETWGPAMWWCCQRAVGFVLRWLALGHRQIFRLRWVDLFGSNVTNF